MFGVRYYSSSKGPRKLVAPVGHSLRIAADPLCRIRCPCPVAQGLHQKKDVPKIKGTAGKEGAGKGGELFTA